MLRPSPPASAGASAARPPGSGLFFLSEGWVGEMRKGGKERGSGREKMREEGEGGKGEMKG